MIDLQQETINSRPITEVGVKDVIARVQLELNAKTMQTNCKFKLAASLLGNERATHMSRFVEIIQSKTWNLNLITAYEIATEIKSKLNAQNAYLQADCTFFLEKLAPISRIPGLVEYDLSYIAKLHNNQSELTICVKVPVTSLCPCSKAISEYGAHNQRAVIELNVTTTEDIAPETLIRLIEKQSSCELYSILKREDEKYVTEYAYNNPKFVEDLVRDTADAVDKLPNIKAYKVVATNYESIHNHQAFACITKGC